MVCAQTSEWRILKQSVVLLCKQIYFFSHQNIQLFTEQFCFYKFKSLLNKPDLIFGLKKRKMKILKIPSLKGFMGMKKAPIITPAIIRNLKNQNLYKERKHCLLQEF